jgi:hypothetical protein
MAGTATSWSSWRPPASVDALLKTAEVFAALGDRDVVAQCIRLAERQAANRCDGDALGRVYAFAREVAAHPWLDGQPVV